MSYILDALKKSEERRQQEQQRLGDAELSLGPELLVGRGQPARWPRALIGAILLLLIIIAALLVYQQFSKPVYPGLLMPEPAPVAQPSQPRELTTPSKGALGQAQISQSQPLANTPSPLSTNSQSVNPSRFAQPPRAEAPGKIMDTNSVAEVTNGNPQAVDPSMQNLVKAEQLAASREFPKLVEETRDAPAEPAAGDFAMGDARAKDFNPALTAETTSQVPSIYELPPSIQQRIPSVSLSSHIYATDASKRRVTLNGKTVGEGHYLTPDLRLHQITEDGVQLKYQQQLFSLDLNTEWQR